MAGATIGFGGVLIVVGVVAFAITGGASATALIPAVMGVLILGLGLAARTWPRAAGPLIALAALVSLLAIGGSFRGVSGFVALLQGEAVLRPVAVIAQTLTLALAVIYLIVLVVRWRSGRTAGMSRAIPPRA